MRRSFAHWGLRYGWDRARVAAYEWLHPHEPWLTRQANAFLDGWLNIALAIGVVVVLFLPQIVELIRGESFRDEFADTTAEV